MKTVDKILETALRMFNEYGYAQVGVREISRELRISPGNLSYHFPKKEDILFRLMENFSRTNGALYEAYFSQSPSIGGFLTMMEGIFRNQYQYRGVFIGNQEVQQALQARKGFDYQQVEDRRRAAFAQIFQGLSNAGHLRMGDEDVSFMVSFMTLFGRFWIAEAFLTGQNRREEEIIGHYLGMLAKQLGLFSTEEGRQVIERFLTHYFQGLPPAYGS